MKCCNFQGDFVQSQAKGKQAGFSRVLLELYLCPSLSIFAAVWIPRFGIVTV